ncbi:MAG: Flp pilus assembly protein CpaB [Chloroflexi bacterium]|nr:MAG: Flp pilus assembly protein CpaB [Chloroflexota bacterium]
MAAIGQARPVTRGNIRTPLFIVGIALALLAFLIMFAFGIVFASKSQTGTQLRVVVAGRDIQAREPITADMIAVSTFPATAAPPKAFSRLADLSGFSAVVAIPKGQAITTNLVAANPDEIALGASSYLPIPKGYVALTLPNSEQQGVAGFIAQGDYINVLAEVNTSQFSSISPRSVARTVFTRVHVIRVGSQSVAPRQGPVQGIASSITVVMTLCDAQYMEWLIINATIKYVLIPYTDYGEAPADPACPTTSAPPTIGPQQVEARWGFTKG